MGMERTAVVFGRSELITILQSQFCCQGEVSHEIPCGAKQIRTYRLRGSLFCFARAIGLYDFITDSGTGVPREEPASTSIAAAAAACPEALRLEKANC